MRKFLPVFLLLAAACNQRQDQLKPDPESRGPELREIGLETRALIKKHEAGVPKLVAGNNDFAQSLYQQLAAKKGNLVFSPYSISNALAMTYAGARGNTAAEMKTTLRFNLDDERLHPTFGSLILQLEGDGRSRPGQLSVANRLWGQKDYGFLPSFLKLGSDFYGNGLEEVDYVSDADGARRTINAWVERQTRNRINNLIPEGALTDATRLVLTNAIYFKAEWQHPFEKRLTKMDRFHLLDGKTIETQMMGAKHHVNFVDFGSLSLVELPYKDSQLSMVAILPKKRDGLPDIEKELTPGRLTAWIAGLWPQEVRLVLPKFKMTSEFQLNDVLKQMGMRDAFVEGTADFRGMATGDKLFISAVRHKTFIEVSEKETEGAAATAVIIDRTTGEPRTGGPPPPPPEFIADHPFIFLIRDRASGSILFLGRVTNPSAGSS